MEMALTGPPITSDEAKSYGLVSRVTENGGTIDAALELAELIAENAPLAVAASKALIQAQQGITEEAFWAQQKPHMKKVFTSNDAMEGPASFAEKRSPNWSGT